MEYLSDIFNTPKFLGYVIEEDGVILGGLLAREKVWWSGSEVFVEEFFVKRSHQGRGYGTMLMKRVEQYMQKNSLESEELVDMTFSTGPRDYVQMQLVPIEEEMNKEENQ